MGTIHERTIGHDVGVCHKNLGFVGGLAICASRAWPRTRGKARC